MAVRYPLIVDTTDNNKIKELPANDSLNLSSNSIVNAVNITASGALSAASLTIEGAVSTVTIGGNTLKAVATTASYNDLTDKPSLFDGQYSSLTGRPSIPNTIESLANVGSTTPTNGQALIYDATLGRYEPGDIADVSIDLTDQSIGELQDVVLSSPAIGQPLAWNGAAFNNTSSITASVTGNVTGNVTGDVTGDVTGNVTGVLTGEVKGSVFADDSTLLVDGVNATIPYAVIDGRPTVVTDLANDAGYVTNAQLTGGSLSISVSALVANSITGSVFADDSTQMLDAESQTLYGTLVATAGTAPTVSGDPGAVGEIRFDDNYIYVKTSGAGWKRAALSGLV